MSGSIPSSSISFSGIVNAYNNVKSTNLSTTNISFSSFRGKSFTDSTTVPSSGAISLNSHFKGKTWSGDGLSSVLESIRQTITKSNAITTLENQGYTVFATPKYGALTESMGSQSPITDGGKFYKTYFDNNNTIVNTSGFSNNTLNGYPWYGFAAFKGTTFKGFLVMMFRNHTSASIKNLFNPVQWNQVYSWVLNANGTTVTDVGGNTRTYFSDSSSIGSNGYYSSSKFSRDDGVWGVCIGRDVNGDSPGPHLDASAANSYGAQNYHSGDSSGSASYLYWGSKISSTDWSLFCFTES